MNQVWSNGDLLHCPVKCYLVTITESGAYFQISFTIDSGNINAGILYTCFTEGSILFLRQSFSSILVYGCSHSRKFSELK